MQIQIRNTGCGSGSGVFLTPGSGIQNGFFPDPRSGFSDPKLIYFWELSDNSLGKKSTRILCKLAQFLFVYLFHPLCTVRYPVQKFLNGRIAEAQPCLWRHNRARGRWGERAWWQRQLAAAAGHGWQCSSRHISCPKHSRHVWQCSCVAMVMGGNARLVVPCVLGTVKQQSETEREEIVYFQKSSLVLKE